MPYYTVPPRPILKRPSPSPSPAASPSHAVHFPPSPSLASIFSAHSAAAYDRSPIVIAPNACTLPERGCPGRTYYNVDGGDDSSSSSRTTPKHVFSASNTIHPRAFVVNGTTTTSAGSCPPLIPDLSSESEESDAFIAPFLPLPHVYAYSPDGLAVSGSRKQYHPSEDSCYSDATTSTKLDAATALSFLPYPPSPLNRASAHLGVDNDDDGDGDGRRNLFAPPSPTPSKPRRRRGSRERRTDRESDRTRNDWDDVVVVVDPRRRSRTMTAASNCRTKSSDRSLSISASSFSSSFGFQDNGCLGGF